jgi:hypothetical protein
MNTVRCIGSRQYQVGVWVDDTFFKPAHGENFYFSDWWAAAKYCNFLNGGAGPVDPNFQWSY